MNCEHGYGGFVLEDYGDIHIVLCCKCNQTYMDTNKYIKMETSELEERIGKGIIELIKKGEI